MYDVLVAEDHPFNQVLISEILDSDRLPGDDG